MNLAFSQRIAWYHATLECLIPAAFWSTARKWIKMDQNGSKWTKIWTKIWTKTRLIHRLDNGLADVIMTLQLLCTPCTMILRVP
jgi:hypothetical protein